MPKFFPYLWRRRKEVNLVYSCSEPTLLTTLGQAIWTKILGKKHVCFTWENIPYGKKFRGPSLVLHWIILRLNLWLSDGLICGNHASADIHRHYTGIPIAVIPMNGLDSAVFSRGGQAAKPMHLDGLTVYTFIGALGYRKGVHLAVRAMPKVIEHVANAHLLVVGSGEYEAEVRQSIDKEGLADRVKLLPWADQKEIVSLLAHSDIFIYPSIPHGGWAEQFGYSMAEASLMELPVISTQSGSIADIILDGRTGLLVRPDDSDALAVAMIKLGSDAQLRERLGKAGREFIIANFSHEIVARKFYDLLSSLVSRNSPQE